MRSHYRTCLASALMACLAVLQGSPVAAQVQPVPQPAAPIDPDRANLHLLEDMFILPASFHGMTEQAIMVLRSRAQADPQAQAREHAYPGIRETRLRAVRAGIEARVPALIVTLRGEVDAFFLRETEQRQRADFAAWLRTSWPQRLIHASYVPRLGETVDGAMQRTYANLQAGMTPQEHQQQAAFEATPSGQLYLRLSAEFQTRLEPRKGALITALIRAALASGADAERAWIADHTAQSPAPQGH